MDRVERRGNGDNGADGGDFRRRMQDGGAAEGMADKQARRGKVLAQKVRGGDQILHLRRKIRFREIPLALPQAGEIETQDAYILLTEGAGDR